MTKHTPAPWRRGITLVTDQTERWSKDQWKKNDEIEISHIFSDFKMEDEGKSRQLVATINRDHPDHEANAHLIVAAPLLLEALEQLMLHAIYDHEVSDQSIAAFEMAKTAIKRTKGER